MRCPAPGGIAAGLTVSNKPVKPNPVALKLAPQPGVIISSKEVVAALKRAAAALAPASAFPTSTLRSCAGGDAGARSLRPEEARR